MEVAAEEDVESNNNGQPALAKLRMLPQLQAKVAERRIHETLMDAGILGCLKAWIEPMPGGHLPNSKVSHLPNPCRIACCSLASEHPLSCPEGT